jgi:hypothetical protein
VKFSLSHHEKHGTQISENWVLKGTFGGKREEVRREVENRNKFKVVSSPSAFAASM